MVQFTHDEATARRSGEVIEQLVAARDSLAAGTGVAFEREHEAVARTAWSWWMLVTDSSWLVLEQTKAGNGLLVAPVTRNLVTHALALPWLIDGGVAALQAVDAYGDEELVKLINAAVEVGWAIGELGDEDRIRRDVAGRQSQLTPEITRLKNELRNTETLMTAYGAKPSYLVYRHLSGFSHTTRDTGKLYLAPVGSGSNEWQIRTRPRPSGFSDVIGVAVSLVQAGQAINRILAGRPLTQPLQEATQHLGLPDDLVPTRRRRR
ncbi:hypothetical protein ACFY8W_04370 [Streptomyces sp. NPDC012637]|uniref:hypothetical protein n=1 Tax=Streptomyces sp. NPDC012637 TaxID=3364842 RepID=UPI0036E980AB